jgi:hypothetical protein
MYASLPTIGPSSEYLSAWPCRAAPERSVRRSASSSRHLRVDATDAVSLFTHEACLPINFRGPPFPAVSFHFPERSTNSLCSGHLAA